MEKNVIGEDVFFQIAWSPTNQFDKYRALGIPEMSGLICMLNKIENKADPEYLIFYSCWRDGLRKGLKDITDPDRKRFPDIIKCIEEDALLYKYTVIDSKIGDMNDIMYWLIREYAPILNNTVDFCDSKRYKHIYLKEFVMDDKDVIECTMRNNIILAAAFFYSVFEINFSISKKVYCYE